MGSYLINVFVLFCVGPFLAFGAVQGSRPRSGQLLVILLDGFRWDYLNYDAFGNDGLRRLIREGTAVEYLQPVYPSDSYPNYYSLMTGENSAMGMGGVNGVYIDFGGGVRCTHPTPTPTTTTATGMGWVNEKKEDTHKYIHTHTYMHVYRRTYTHTYIHTYKHTYIRPHIHAYIHTYIHTYT